MQKALGKNASGCLHPGSDNVPRDSLKFTLTDKTDVKTVKYIPATDGKIAGTNLIVDEVTFEKSDLSMVCNVKYHYAGNKKNWEYTTIDGGIVFDLLDENGNMVDLSDSGYGGETSGWKHRGTEQQFFIKGFAGYCYF